MTVNAITDTKKENRDCAYLSSYYPPFVHSAYERTTAKPAGAIILLAMTL